MAATRKLNQLQIEKANPRAVINVRSSKPNAMRKLIPIVLLVVAPVLVKGQDVKSMLEKTAEAYGGKAWEKVNYIRMHHIGHQHWLEQSENPEGPFITSYTDTEEIRSTKGLKLYQKTESKMGQSPEPNTLVYVQNDSLGYMAFGDRKMPSPYSYGEENIRWLTYGPEHLLTLARTSATRFDQKVDLEGVNHYQLSFTVAKTSYKIFINASTFLISEAWIDTYSPNEFFFSLWGKFTTRIQYTLYALHKGNIVYPEQWDVYRAGHLWKKISVNNIEFLEATDESAFTVPDEIKKAPLNKRNVNGIKLPVDQAIEVAKGIFVIPGNWFAGWAEQADGIVVIEAPISSGYSVQLMNEVKKRYPAKKIKGVVVSSDAWPHLAGVREYFAASIPVYTNKLNKPILDRISVVDHSPAPDHQQVKKAKPVYALVDKVVSLDDKNVPIQIIPVQGEGGERMVAVYFPKQKVLYASDLVQQMRDKSFFFIEYLSEVKAVVDRHKLDVETVYAMHTRPVAWKDITAALDQNK